MPHNDKSPAVKEVADRVADWLYGMTITEALDRGLCIRCHDIPRFYSEAGKREYTISGLCEYCFDELTEGKELDG